MEVRAMVIYAMVCTICVLHTSTVIPNEKCLHENSGLNVCNLVCMKAWVSEWVSKWVSVHMKILWLAKQQAAIANAFEIMVYFQTSTRKKGK